MRFDWKFPVAIVLFNVVMVAVQWGMIYSKIDELFRTKEQQERHLEFIDSELTKRVGEAGEAKAFHDEVIRRFDGIDRKLDGTEQRRR